MSTLTGPDSAGSTLTSMLSASPGAALALEKEMLVLVIVRDSRTSVKLPELPLRSETTA